eukprot:2409698-Rhodomonas_salina.1
MACSCMLPVVVSVTTGAPSKLVTNRVGFLPGTGLTIAPLELDGDRCALAGHRLYWRGQPKSYQYDFP